MPSPAKLLLALSLLALLAAPALPGGAAAPAPAGATHAVDVFDFGYEDRATGTFVTVASVGDLVAFRFTKGIHTVTEGFYAKGDPTGVAFESGIRSSGTYTLALTEPGVFPYTCRLHPQMNGVLVVGA